MINTKLRPLMLALLAGLAVAGAVHAESGDEIYKRKRQEAEDWNNLDRDNPWAGMVTRAQRDEANCAHTIRNLSGNQPVPDYDCMALYVLKIEKGLWTAPTLPARDQYDAWRSVHQDRRNDTYRVPALPASASRSVHSELYDRYRAAVRAALDAHKALSPFGKPTADKQVAYDQAMASLPAIKAALDAVPAAPKMPIGKVQAVMADESLMRVVIGAPAALSISAMVDVAEPHSLISIASYLSLVRSGQAQLTLIFDPLHPDNAAVNAAVAESATPYRVLQDLIDAATQSTAAAKPALRPTGSDANTARMLEQARMLQQNAGLVSLPVTRISAGEGAVQWLMGVHPWFFAKTGDSSARVSMHQAPLIDVLRKVDPKLRGDALRTDYLTEAEYTLLRDFRAFSSTDNPRANHGDFARLMGAMGVSSSEPRRFVDPPASADAAKYTPTETERAQIETGRYFYR